MINIGVAGAGHLGKIHIKLIKELSADFNLAGFYDVDEGVREMVASEFNIDAHSNVESLVQVCDAIVVVTPTPAHFRIAQAALRKFKHVFIEKPVTGTLEEARQLSTLALESGMKVQVGHVERYNPAFTAVRTSIDQPMFIEAHRLAQFNPRGTDVPVVLDLMIHDIDVILSVVKSNVRRIHASGVAVVSDTPDIANARIEFDNGCVANLTASRISMKNMRKTRFFQKDAYISVDFLEKQAEVVRMRNVEHEDPFAFVLDLGEKGKREINIHKPQVLANNAIKDELADFAAAIRGEKEPTVSLTDGIHALDLALQITEKLKAGTPLVD
jgi:predicted dehydrogenase